MEFQINWDLVLAWFLGNGLRAVVTLILAMIALKLAGTLSNKVGLLLTWKFGEDPEIKKRAKTLASFLRYVLVFLIITTAGMMLLKEFGVEIRPILASAGIVGLAIGFGAQNLVQDVISGFFILLEDQIRVGDVVKVKDRGGMVEKVGLRMIVLRDFDGSVHYIRNGQIDVVTNMTKDFSNYVFDLRIPYGQDLDKAMKLLKQIDEEVRASELGVSILKPLEIFGVDQLSESWVILRARYSTKPLKQWDVGRNVNGRIKEKFEAHGIPFAHPHVMLKVAEGEKQVTTTGRGAESF